MTEGEKKMNVLGKAQGRHVKRKRVLAVAAAVLAAAAAAGGLQLVGAASSPAATAGATVKDLGDWVGTAADGSIYYGFESDVSARTRAVTEEAAKAWNERLGRDLLRAANSATGKPQVRVSVVKNLSSATHGHLYGEGSPSGELRLSHDLYEGTIIPGSYMDKKRLHTAVHELGHVLGLDHPVDIASCDSVMRAGATEYKTPDGKPCESEPGIVPRPSADEAATVKAHYEPGAKRDGEVALANSGGVTSLSGTDSNIVKRATEELMKLTGKSQAEARAQVAADAENYKVSMDEAAQMILKALAQG
ncbi:hypothetical protein [Streptomyces sp. NPDC006459]|uniref:hypothetical protein n=1 Tax=Streptomyces sp. NPDC006459 TaxID=3154303 RepID=UPI0033BD7AE2